MFMIYVDCQAPLELDNGHDWCPSCWVWLSLATSASSLTQLEVWLGSQVSPALRHYTRSPRAQKHPAQLPWKASSQPVGGPNTAASLSPLKQQPPVLSLAVEVPEEYNLSTRASDILDVDEWGDQQRDVSHDSEVHSLDTGHSSLRGLVSSHTSVVKHESENGTDTFGVHL